MTGSKSTSRPQRLRFRPKQRPKKLAEMDDLPSELLSCIFEHLRELGVRASEMARLALVQKSWRHVAQAEMCRVLELHHCDAIFSLVDSGLLSRHPVQELTVTRQVGFATDEVLASIRGLKKFTATNVGIEIPALLTDGLQGLTELWYNGAAPLPTEFSGHRYPTPSYSNLPCVRRLRMNHKGSLSSDYPSGLTPGLRSLIIEETQDPYGLENRFRGPDEPPGARVYERLFSTTLDLQELQIISNDEDYAVVRATIPHLHLLKHLRQLSLEIDTSVRPRHLDVNSAADEDAPFPVAKALRRSNLGDLHDLEDLSILFGVDGGWYDSRVAAFVEWLVGGTTRMARSCRSLRRIRIERFVNEYAAEAKVLHYLCNSGWKRVEGLCDARNIDFSIVNMARRCSR